MTKPIALVNIVKPENIKIPPLALLYVGGALKGAGYDVKALQFKNTEIEKYAKEVVSRTPLYVGISVFTGDKTKDSADFSRKVKELNQEIPIVWGGIHPTLLPLQTLSEDYVDYICLYEGDETIVELTRAIEKTVKLEDVEGIGYKVSKKTSFLTPRRDTIKPECLQLPDWSLINVEDFLDEQWGSERILGYVTSRGCPYDCTFCYNQVFNRRKWRPHSEKRVIEQVNWLKDEYDLDGIRFYDDLFFADPKRAISILEQVDLPWYAEIRTNLVTEKLVEKLVETNAREMLLGLESGSDRVLKMMNKNQTVDQIVKSVEVLSKAKDVRVVGSMIVGVPTETQEEVNQTIDLMLTLSNIHPNMRYTVGPYTPYPGSEMFDLAVRMGFEPPDRTEDWCILDRWSDRLDPVWLDWSHDREYFFRIREYAILLAMRGLKIPYLKDVPEKRLREKDFSHGLELRVLTHLQQAYSRPGRFREVGSKVLSVLGG